MAGHARPLGLQRLGVSSASRTLSSIRVEPTVRCTPLRSGCSVTVPASLPHAARTAAAPAALMALRSLDPRRPIAPSSPTRAGTLARASGPLGGRGPGAPGPGHLARDRRRYGTDPRQNPMGGLRRPRAGASGAGSSQVRDGSAPEPDGAGGQWATADGPAEEGDGLGVVGRGTWDGATTPARTAPAPGDRSVDALRVGAVEREPGEELGGHAASLAGVEAAAAGAGSGGLRLPKGAKELAVPPDTGEPVGVPHVAGLELSWITNGQA